MFLYFYCVPALCLMLISYRRNEYILCFLSPFKLLGEVTCVQEQMAPLVCRMPQATNWTSPSDRKMLPVEGFC